MASHTLNGAAAPAPERIEARASVNESFWQGRSVLVTGHTGFKGAWLSLWLQSLGARVTGLSRGIPSKPSLYALARVDDGMHESITGDIRDATAVERALDQAEPEVVIHMAAQPFVRRSYEEPRATFEANVMGTVNVLDAVRRADTASAVVCVTSDKCYENVESDRSFREGDPLGGHDPYSASKGAAEIAVSAYRRSFFSSPNAPRVASARAGNVFGGGDWGEDRLIPDILRAAASGQTLHVRSPNATRPWQHVLCPISGYLLLAQRLCESPGEHAAVHTGVRSSGSDRSATATGGSATATSATATYARPWNFGPDPDDIRPVGAIVRELAELWPGELSFTEDDGPHPHEAQRLALDSSDARQLLGWEPALSLTDGLRATVEWHVRHRDGEDMRQVTLDQIEAC
jgi:CDP-glucose 4,6-dehydratase